MDEVSSRQTCMGYHSEGGTGWTTRTVSKWRKPKLIIIRTIILYNQN